LTPPRLPLSPTISHHLPPSPTISRDLPLSRADLAGEVVDAAEEDEGEAVVLARDGGDDVLVRVRVGVRVRMRVRVRVRDS